MICVEGMEKNGRLLGIVEVRGIAEVRGFAEVPGIVGGRVMV